MAIAVIAPDMRALSNFFFLHRPCTPMGGWTKPARRYGLRVETVATAVMLVITVAILGGQIYQGYAQQLANMKHPQPLTGQWHVQSALLAGQPRPFLTGDGLPMTDFFIEPSGRVMVRDSANVLWRAGINIDDKKHTLRLGSTGSGDAIVYSMVQPDPAHLVLTPTGDAVKTAGVLTMARVPLPSHYPLEERGFHFINEWGLER